MARFLNANSGQMYTPKQSVAHLKLCSSSRCSRRSLMVQAAYNGSRNLPYTTAGTPAGAAKIADYLRSPFDLAAFGPRLFLGAALSSREIAQNLQRDIERAQSMMRGPRPNSEKQEFLTRELEARLTQYLERGAYVEAEILTAAAAVLPEDVKRQMPPEIKDIMLRGTIDKRVQPTAPTVQEAQNIPMASVTKSQTQAEVEDIRGAVTTLRLAITELKNNTEEPRTGVLKLNVKDARSALSQRLQQLSPDSTSFKGAPIQAAADEAKLLLKEADSLQL